MIDYHLFSQYEKILDIGCGDGEITKSLSDYGKTTGIDLCSNMIEFARKNNSNKNTNYINTSILDFNNNSEPYSLVTAFNSIYWCGDLKNVFSKINHLLCDHGKFLIITYPKESPYWTPIIDLLNSDKWEEWKHSSIANFWITTDEYIKIINNNNLKLLKCDASIELVSYSDKSEYINYIKGWLPLMFNDGFNINDFINDLVAKVFGYNKSITMKYKKVILYGQK